MKLKLIIDGMTCNHCVMHVENALKDIEAINNVKVDFDNDSALIEYDDEISLDIVKDALEDIGYELVRTEEL